MLDTFQIYTELKESLEAQTAEKIAIIMGRMYEELCQNTTEAEFAELKAVVSDLAKAQQATEQQVSGLAKAQQATEQQVSGLAKAQQATEQQVKELVQAQQATEQQVKELAKAQEKTERTVKQLAKQVGGLSEHFGGDIEDISYIVLHDVLERELGWQMGVLERVWHNWGKEPEEVNIFGQATDPKEPDKTIWIVGEAKHNVSKKEVNKFIKQLKRARQNLNGEIFPVFFCYRAHPEVQKMILDAEIRLVFSYGKLV
ncbi:hypothetical protein [Candidatus Parabeggiatoa sp. HSG14]|uniref:hypothetical protein n=1 Tax=Candidatus Parabeggiatoa sp. HSG14 TaxID=3055593 RepID=UPI0025A70EFE|nr:hypothetical protein [Thiotrichales bacterium HSG14]